MEWVEAARHRDLQERTDKHEIQLGRINATVEKLVSSVEPPIQHVSHKNAFAASIEVLEMLAGQAKAVEDLDYVVREDSTQGDRL